MIKRNAAGIFKTNLPQYLWICLPLYIGAIIFALDGSSPDWISVGLFFATATVLVGVAEVSNTYADRGEDQIFVPSSPLVTGEIKAGTAKKVLIWQNIIGGLLLIALLVVTLNYWLVLALAIGWLVGLTYSLPPLRFKETIMGPFFWSVGIGLLPIVAWLAVAPLNDFIIAFSIFWFVVNFEFALSMTKLRKTFDALAVQRTQIGEGKRIWDLTTSGVGLKIRTAVVLVTIEGLGAFALVPIFWHLEIFDKALSIALLSLPLAFMILTVVFRIKNPVKNTRKCEQFSGMSFTFIILSFFSVSLTNVLHWNWGFASLASLAFLVGFILLLKYVHPFGVAYRPLDV